jgi:hypothetical protein
VAFVHVVLSDTKPEGIENPHAPDPEDDLLLQAVPLVAAVQDVRDLSIFREVLLKVGVEKEDGDSAAGEALKDVLPGCDGNVRTISSDGSQTTGCSICLPLGSSSCRKLPSLLMKVTATRGSPRSALDRTVSPARVPRPPA